MQSQTWQDVRLTDRFIAFRVEVMELLRDVGFSVGQDVPDTRTTRQPGHAAGTRSVPCTGWPRPPFDLGLSITIAFGHSPPTAYNDSASNLRQAQVSLLGTCFVTISSIHFIGAAHIYRRRNAGRSLRRRRCFSSKHTASRDLLQRAVGFQQRRRRLFVLKKQVVTQ